MGYGTGFGVVVSVEVPIPEIEPMAPVLVTESHIMPDCWLLEAGLLAIIFYLYINQLDALNFIMNISCLYIFRAQVLIVRRPKLYYTAFGIITLKQVSGLKLLK